jgi:hypothetical protein
MLAGSITPNGLPIPVAFGSPTVTFTAGQAGGSWWQLQGIYKTNVENARVERQVGPIACPNDGEPLLWDPRLNRRRCPYDGWISPV